jgi:hypothetical protein
MKKSIYVYGTGSLAKKYLLPLSLEYDVLGFVESNPTKDTLLGLPVISVKSLTTKSFDLIIVCSMYLKEIETLLNESGITNYKSVKHLEDTVALQKLWVVEQQKEQQKILDDMHPPKLDSKHIERCILLKDRYALLESLPKQSIGAEIGVANGDFTEDILSVVEPKLCHLIDIWGSDRYGQKMYESVLARFDKRYSDGTLFINRGLSIECVSNFEDNFFDWVYIDTDHSYKTTLQELRCYSEKVKDGGLIMGHDYAMGNWQKQLKYGVIEAVFQFCVEENYELVYLTMELTQSFAIRKIVPSAHC